MKTIFVTLLILLMLPFSLIAQEPEWQWAINAGGSSADFGYGIAKDDAGNIYVTGHFLGTATFGSYSLTSSGSYDIFVAKMDVEGNVLWATQAGGGGSDYGFGIETDNIGNSYVTGWFEETATFGSYNITSNGGTDIYVAKMDANGNWLWATKAGGTTNYHDCGNAIAIDDTGNSYVTGYFQSTATFGPYSITSSGHYDIFVAKLDANGNWQWAKQAGYSGDGDYGYGIGVDDYGNSYLTGMFRGTATFGSYSLTSSGSYDIFVAKMDVDGNWQWATKAGGWHGDYGYGIAVDAAGNSYVTGNFRYTATFGSYTITSSSDECDIFIAKINTDGDWLWATKAGGSDGDYGHGIAKDDVGNSYVTGYFQDTSNFGSHTITSSGETDIFVAKMDSDGNWLWAIQAGGSEDDYGESITIDNTGCGYITGHFNNAATFGSYPLTSEGGLDIFIAKIYENPTLINIPGDYPTIQEGINAASDGDTVLVQTGTYVENINYNGKNIIVGSLFLTTQDTSYITQTIIDGNQNGSVVTFENGEDSTAVLTGFKITNGDASQGGGIYCLNSSPSLENVMIIGNSANNDGGGIFIYNVNGDFINFNNLLITDNDSNSDGGGIYVASVENGQLTISNCIIKNNTSSCGGGISIGGGGETKINNSIISYNISPGTGNGAGVHFSGSGANLNIFRTLISNNGGGADGGGLYLRSYGNYANLEKITLYNNTSNYPEHSGILIVQDCEVDLNNSIIDNFGEDGIGFYMGGSIDVSYSDIVGIDPNNGGSTSHNGGLIVWIEGNINSDPLFIDPDNENFNIFANSPCVDTGDPDPQYNDPDGTRADMGAYYFDQSSITPPVAEFVGDPLSGETPLNVNFTDESIPGTYDITSWEWDFDNDGNIDSYIQHPNWSYAEPGLYTVSLTVYDGTNSDTETKVDYIEVTDGGTVTDIDGNVYQTVQIGDQEWIMENLKVTHYRNGDPIPQITHVFDWSNTLSGAYCVYDNNPSNAETYGNLYKWFAVDDPRGIAPEGWHVPTDGEWQTLVDYLGGESVAGGKLKEAGFGHWNPPNTGATNESGFTALPGGYRFATGDFYGMGMFGLFWSSTEYNTSSALYWEVNYNSSEADRHTGGKGGGFSVRCISDEEIVLIADFTSDTQTGTAPLTVQFTDLSTPPDSITYWEWDFENDGSVDSYEQSPQWVYNDPGLYTVSLTVSDGVNSDTETKNDYINVYSTVATPVFDPEGGTYPTPQSVEITTTTTGDSIYYTTDGTDPDQTSQLYSTPVQINTSTTLKARAYKQDWLPSTISTAIYTITGTVATPVFDPAGGTYTTPQTVEITTTTTGASIYYTKDGTDPDQTSQLYSTPVQINTSTTLKARAYKEDWLPSTISSAIYNITGTVATPVFNPEAGIYTEPKSVEITTTTSGASIYYTTDGTDPDQTSQLYSSPVQINTSTTLKARAYKEDWLPSTISSAIYTITGTVETPIFDPVGGTYTTPQSVEITTITTGASIYYTTDGTDPDTTSQIYYTPVQINTTTILRARAYKEDWLPSLINTEVYEITGTIAPPIFDPTGGTYPTPQTVEISTSTAGVSIYYTTDGSEPDESSQLYSTPVQVNTSLTIKARAYKDGWLPSNISTAIYTITGTVAAPVFNPLSGIYTEPQNVEITSTTTGALIYYSTDGTDPDETSELYSSPVQINTDTTIKARAYKQDWLPSTISTAIYTITGTVATPVFDPVGGIYTEPTSVVITTNTSGASIYYTTDDTDPDQTSQLYSSPIQINTNTTLKARAYKQDWLPSTIITAIYTITGTVAEPVFTPAGGIYTETQNVEITSTTSGSNIYYTIDGTDPDQTSQLYSSPVQINTSTTLKARAYKQDWLPSLIITETYEITGTITPPVFDPIGGIYPTPQTVEISTTTAGVSIYYTNDGSDPDESSQLYSSPVQVNTSTTLKARAYKDGWLPSNISTAIYTITGTVDTPVFDPVAGAYPVTQEVTITTTSSGAIIYYTKDGSDPDDTSQQYSEPIEIALSTTLKARAYKQDWLPSQIATAYYEITGTVAQPVFDPSGGIFTEPQTIEITTTTNGANIYFTLDGSDPNQSSNVYSEPVFINISKTLKARAYKQDWLPSSIESADYTITGTVTTPTLHPGAGFYPEPIFVKILCSIQDVTIYYTLDGSIPDQTSIEYTDSIHVDTSLTIKARAYKQDWNTSEVATGEYFIQETEPHIEVDVDSLSFGNVTVGETSGLKNFLIFNQGNEDLIVNEITAPVGFKIRRGDTGSWVMNIPIFTIAESSFQKIYVKFIPAEAITYSDHILISSNDPNHDTVLIDVYGVGVEYTVPNIEIDPIEILFGDVTILSDKERHFAVSNTGSAELIIDSIFVPNNSGFMIRLGSSGEYSNSISEFSLSPEDGEDIYVKFSPGITGYYSAYVTINSNDQDTQTITVFVTGTGVNYDVPNIEINLLELHFGEVELFQNVEKTIMISNTGNAVLEIGDVHSLSGYKIKLDGGVWSNNISAFNIAPAEDKIVHVKFHPEALISYNGFIYVTSNDPDESSIPILVEGQGIPVLAEKTPDAFTPNGDGLNDEFIIGPFQESGSEQAKFKVFDLHGKLIHETNGAANEPLFWNGRDNSGNRSSSGAYIYVYLINNAVYKSGKIYLVR